MIVISSSDSIRVVTTSANAVHAVVFYANNAAASFSPSVQNTNIAAAATTTIKSSPAGVTTDNLSNITLRAVGGANTLTVQFFDGAAASELVQVALSAGDTLVYENGHGWAVTDSSGATKTVSSGTPGHVIRVNDVAQTQRAAFNLLNTADVTFAATDDGANGETELRATFTTTAAIGGRLLRAPQIVTATNAAFAHPTGTKAIVVEGVGSGGGGGGCAATQGAVGSGGNSGNWGRKTFTSISGTSNITIGAAGTVGSAAAGGNGGNCSFVHNAVTFTLPGGIGGTILAGAATVAAATANAGNAASTGADIDTVGQVGKRGYRNAAAATAAISGTGGSNPLGSGGQGFGGVNGNGVAATGHGAGGGGAAAVSSATAGTGGTATAGAFIIWEFG